MEKREEKCEYSVRMRYSLKYSLVYEEVVKLCYCLTSTECHLAFAICTQAHTELPMPMISLNQWILLFKVNAITILQQNVYLIIVYTFPSKISSTITIVYLCIGIARPNVPKSIPTTVAPAQTLVESRIEANKLFLFNASMQWPRTIVYYIWRIKKEA